MKVLVVDDSSTMRRIIANALKKVGAGEIVEAGNGAEGLQQLNAGTVDLIVTDWNMPVMNGLEFVRELRSLASCATTPVLMVTTNAESADVSGAKEAGVNDYVVKPFTADTLQDKISALMKK
jgi:two-component system, chemotaxis family, chemotaxis protein CheY